MSNFSISSRPAGTVPGQTVSGGGQTEQASGAGALGAAGPLPDVGGVHGGAAFSASFQTILGSIIEMMPEMTSEDQEVKLLEITIKLREMQDMIDKDKIQVDATKKQTALAEKQAKLDEATKKMEEAKGTREGMSIWDKIKAFFMWLGALIMMALGAIAMATGVGAVAGGLLMAAGVASLVMAIDATIKIASPNGVGIAGSIAMSLGQSKEQAQQADMIFGYVMVAVSVALAVASLGTSIGPALSNAIMGTASGAGRGAAVALDAVEQALNAAAKATTTAQMGLKGAQSFATVANDLITISTATGDAVVGGMRYDASMREADGMQTKADAKQMEAFIQLIDDMIDQTMARMRASNQRFEAIIDDIIDTIKDRGDSLSQAKFTA